MDPKIQQAVDRAKSLGYSDEQIKTFLGSKGINYTPTTTAQKIASTVSDLLPTKNLKENVQNAAISIGQFASGDSAGLQQTTDRSTAIVPAATKEALNIGLVADSAAAVPAIAKGAASIASKGASKAISTIADTVPKAAEILHPSPKPIEAVGEILQGKTKDIKPGLVALKNVDVQGVKTYKELQARIDGSIQNLSRQVDAELAKDTNTYQLAQLTTKTTSPAGRVVETNYVDKALNNLEELYAKTADDASAAKIQDLIDQAKSSGLTRKEVNDISRLYNTEFGAKAFSATGDPLTSVNAQAYENIRSGLKEVARAGIGGPEAQAADKVISSLYNTKILVQKNVEAVNKLNQRIADRGLLEKLGASVTKYADILTGGSIRGFIGGLLPRGSGYKVLNAVDLEERLAKNLEIIDKALKSGSDKEIEALIKTLSANGTIKANEQVTGVGNSATGADSGMLGALADNIKSAVGKMKGADSQSGFISTKAFAIPEATSKAPVIPNPVSFSKKLQETDIAQIDKLLTTEHANMRDWLDAMTQVDDILRFQNVPEKTINWLLKPENADDLQAFLTDVRSAFDEGAIKAASK